MNRFSAGLLAGAVIGAGVAMTIHPYSKKEIRRMRSKANKMLCNAGRMMGMR